VLTAGGPGTATTTLVWQTYLTTFDSLDFGLGNAYAYTVSLITFGLALVYFRILYRRGGVRGLARWSGDAGAPATSFPPPGGGRGVGPSFLRFPSSSSPGAWGRERARW